MKYSSPCRCVGSALLVLTLPACAVLHPGRPITIEARDAETHQPIPMAHVEIKDVDARGFASGTTGKDGIVRLQDNAHDGPIGVQATAHGYMFQQSFVPAETVRAIQPAPRFGSDKLRPVAFTVELYAEPRPEVELVLPAGYRGTVKAEITILRDVPITPGQRLFSFPVSAQGDAQVSGPKFIERVQPVDYRFRYADGSPLSRQADTTPLGFWWMRHDGSNDFFFVGDKGEYAVARSSEEPGTRRARLAGGGRGGRHHRGGMGSSAGDP